MILTRKRVIGAALVAAVLLTLTVLSRALWPETCRIENILAAYREQGTYADIALVYPFDATLFPPELPPPTFRWQDSERRSRRWLVRITCPDGEPDLRFLVRRPQWTPAPQEWESLKHRSLEREAQVVILGVGRGAGTLLSRARLSFRTSKDPVGTPLFYREVILPFRKADQDPSRIRWRFGPISSP